MNVSGINSGTVNLEALLSRIGDVQKTTDVATGKEVLTLSVRNDGVPSSYTVNFPQIEAPANMNPEAIDSLIGKLQDGGALKFTADQFKIFKEQVTKTYAKTADAVETVSSSSKKSNVMFDIYTLMALLVEVAQKQKEANRETRRAQHSAVQKAIQDQADQQRAAAEIGLIVGVVCGAVSAIASAVMMGMQISSFAKQMQITKNAGLDAQTTKASALAHTDTVAHADAKLQTVEAQVGVEVADRVKADFSNQLVDDQAGNLGQNFEQARTNLANADTAKATAENNLQSAKNDLETARANQQTAQQELDAKKAEVGLDAKQAQFDRAVADRDNPQMQNLFGKDALNDSVTRTQNALNDAKAAVAPKETALNNARQAVTDAQAEVNNRQNDVNIANQNKVNAENAFNQAKSNYSKTVQDVGDQYAEKYQTALERRDNPVPGADKAQLEQDVQTARAEMEMARAYEAKLLAADDVMTPSEQKDMVKMARAEVQDATKAVFNRNDYKIQEQRIQLFSGINGIVTSLGQMGQNIGQGVSSMQSAEATKIGAEEKRQEELAEQSKELYDEEQKLIDSVLQLMQAVAQAETQSMRDAIQA